MKKTVGILGCGWFGMALAKALQADGFEVKGSTTTAAKFELLKQAHVIPYLIDLDKEKANLAADFFECDILFICITPKVNSAAVPYATKIKTIANCALNKVKHLVMISSTGVFEDGNFSVDEHTVPQPKNAAGLALLAAENVLKVEHSFTSTIIRFAGLIGPERNLAKHFAGKNDIGNGLAPINLIHLSDCIGLCKKIIEKEAFGGIYHGVSPHHPSRKEFYTQACIASGFVKPTFTAEKLSWKQVDSINVPDILDYKYLYNNWDKYLKELKRLAGTPT